MSVSFSPEVVGAALGVAVAGVEVSHQFDAFSAEVARLRVELADDGAPLTVIGKWATGDRVAGARRELRFFEHVAPLWDHPAPRLLGAWDGEGEDGGLLLVMEDLDAAGYAVIGGAVSEPQLHGAIATLVELHARFWDDLPLAIRAAGGPETSVTRAARAWPREAIAVHAAAIEAAAARFVAAQAGELTPAERALIGELIAGWAPQLLARVGDGRAITLIHADFHFLGNVLFSPREPRPRVIDWSECKPGLGPHDLAYCLAAVPCAPGAGPWIDRPARDLALVRRYWDGLIDAGVRDYSWARCAWDFRFSLIANLFQALFQNSVMWFRKSAAAIEAMDCRAALRDGPPA